MAMSRGGRGSVVVSCLMLALFMLLGEVKRLSAQRPGFISIDCGSSENYTDPDTGIKWVTDDGYISTGFNEKVPTTLDAADNWRAIRTSRTFPSTPGNTRKKHCYTLPVSANSTYLVRAMFHYGVRTLTESISFNGSVDSTLWGTVSITPDIVQLNYVAEAITTTLSEQVSLCLIDTGTGTPFISSLELRPLGNAYASSRGNLLPLITRSDCGGWANIPSTRFPNDPLDRLWFGTNILPNDSSGNAVNNRPSIRTQLPMPQDVPTTFSVQEPPQSVMQSAWVGTPLQLVTDVTRYPLTSTFLANFYFWDFQPYIPGAANNSRVFNVDDVSVDGPNLDYTAVLNASNTAAQFSHTLFNITTSTSYRIITKDNMSRPAIINAFELFSVIPLSRLSDANDVKALVDMQMALTVVPLWAGDPCLPVPWDWIKCDLTNSTPRVNLVSMSSMNLSGNIPPSVLELTELTHLWLDRNNFSGSIPGELSSLTKLQTLHLYNNRLTGTIPSSLASLPNLVELFVYNNQLSGDVPPELTAKTNLKIIAFGNPGLRCRGINVICTNTTHSSSNKKSRAGIIAGSLVGFVAVLVFIAFCAVFFLYLRPLIRGHKKDLLLYDSPQKNSIFVEGCTRAFSLKEVGAATSNFSTEIAEGGFGRVYYGKLSDGQEVAVKVKSITSQQGDQEFFSEVDLLSRIHHRNLVSLVGYCQENLQQVLIYSYMRNGTLRDHLYGGEKYLDWRERLEIAADSARGLAYLHTGCTPAIIHRDVKSNNILLDDKLKGKVADFGISKVKLGDETGVETLVKGTYGYMDPEYFQTQRLTPKSDIFSFGVVLLEMVTARAPITGETHLIEWSRSRLDRLDLQAVVDPALKGDYDIDVMWKFIGVAMQSVEIDPVKRPDMTDVLNRLTECMELEVTSRSEHIP